MAENGTPVPELLEILGLLALMPVRKLLQTATSPRMELEVVGISPAVGKICELAVLPTLLNADRT